MTVRSPASGHYHYVSINPLNAICSSLLSRTRTAYLLMYLCCLLSVLVSSRKVLSLRTYKSLPF